MRKNKYSSKDYLPSYLPTNRKEVFFDVYKVRFSLIIKCGLVLLLFAIPLLISIIGLDFLRFGISSYTKEELEGFFFYWNISSRCLIIPSLYILLIGISGVMRIFKLLVFQEGIDFWHDFKIGIKDNYKSFAIPSLIFTGIYLIYFIAFGVVFDSIIQYVVLGFISILFVPLYIWSIFISNIYSSKVKQVLENSMFFFGRSIFFSLMISLLTIWPFLFEYFQIPFNVYVFIFKPLGLALMLVFYYPLLMIIMTLYSNHHFDKYINIDAYKELYRRGLFNPEDYKDEY